MNTDKKDAWLTTDDYESEIIVGNRLGLLSLRDAIDKTLESEEEKLSDYIQDTNIDKIILKEKSEYLSSFGECEEALERYKETIWDRIINSLYVIWFLVLPFIAVALIVYCLFFINKEKVFHSTPMQNLIERQNHQLP
jgi:hypothetical protein